MKTITVTLIDAAAGTWITKIPGQLDLANGDYTEPRTVGIMGGVLISADRDYGQLADALEPGIRLHFGRERDAMVQCYDPTATNLGCSEPATEPVCQFRIFDGEIEAQVSRS